MVTVPNASTVVVEPTLDDANPVKTDTVIVTPPSIDPVATAQPTIQPVTQIVNPQTVIVTDKVDVNTTP